MRNETELISYVHRKKESKRKVSYTLIWEGFNMCVVLHVQQASKVRTVFHTASAAGSKVFWSDGRGFMLLFSLFSSNLD